MDSSLNMFFIQGERLFNPTRGKHVLMCAKSHRCEVNTLWKLACNFSTFSKVFEETSFRKLLTESEWSDRF